MEVSKWKPSQVADWLRQNEMVKQADHFLEASVDGSCLLALTDDDLKELGISVSITRKSVLNCIARLKAGCFVLIFFSMLTSWTLSASLLSTQNLRLVLLLLLRQLLLLLPRPLL